MNGNIGIPSLLFTGILQEAAVSIQGDPRKTDPQRENLLLLFFGWNVCLCVMDNFSNKVYSISQLENMSSITWKRDE